MTSGQEVIHWMNQAYEAAERGNPERTFQCWEQAWKQAESNEQRYLDIVERRPLMNQAYEKSARALLHYAAQLREKEQAQSLEQIPFLFHEARRNAHVSEWARCIERAYEHALECNNRPLRRCIQEERTKHPLKPYWRTRIKQALWLL